jgi:hypothetical protein
MITPQVKAKTASEMAFIVNVIVLLRRLYQNALSRAMSNLTGLADSCIVARARARTIAASPVLVENVLALVV